MDIWIDIGEHFQLAKETKVQFTLHFTREKKLLHIYYHRIYIITNREKAK
jgi:hypothetical protein